MGDISILASSNPLIHIVQHTLFVIPIGKGIEFTNHMLMILLSGALLLVLFPWFLRKRDTGAPHGIRNLIESICVYFREEMARPILGEYTDAYISYIWTTFFFILFCNMLGLIPLAEIVNIISGGRFKHIGGTATANIWVTGSLAVLALVIINVSGIKSQGVWGYLKTFVPPVPWPLVPFMFVLEFMSLFTKAFALAIRLFANMLAGHTVIMALLGLAVAARNYPIEGVTVIGCAVFSALELFVAFLQAYIFTFLVTIFIGAAVKPSHE